MSEDNVNNNTRVRATHLRHIPEVRDVLLARPLRAARRDVLGRIAVDVADHRGKGGAADGALGVV